MALVRDLIEYAGEKVSIKVWFCVAIVLSIVLSCTMTYTLMPEKVVVKTVTKEVVVEVTKTDENIPKLTDEVVSLRKKLLHSESQVNQLRNQLVDAKAEAKAQTTINDFYKKQLDRLTEGVFEN